jgi:hypothetical protein
MLSEKGGREERNLLSSIPIILSEEEERLEEKGKREE